MSTAVAHTDNWGYAASTPTTRDHATASDLGTSMNTSAVRHPRGRLPAAVSDRRHHNALHRLIYGIELVTGLKELTMYSFIRQGLRGQGGRCKEGGQAYNEEERLVLASLVTRVRTKRTRVLERTPKTGAGPPPCVLALPAVGRAHRKPPDQGE
ncbi:hypothetical protein HPB47_020816 [Ixodes persulcatus]|uniref:Uncharacterized protein n=1 Tax=Ixodes persulcatus TaxID=34615 RepID=A0AC60QF54_IXOPE|nr:hypothetical protein HPB47_020816 [Ixodes persulcatus]